MKWFVKCIRNYVNFKGRASRSEYWYFVLFTFLFMMVAQILDMVFFNYPTQVFTPLMWLFLILPSFAVTVRRLHDTNHSGMQLFWYYIVSIIMVFLLWVFVFATAFSAAVGGNPLNALSIGGIVLSLAGMLVILIWGVVLLVWCCLPGTAGENKYGPDPKTVEA